MKKFAYLLITLCIWQLSFAKNLYLVEFSTNDYDSTLVWLTKLEARGVSSRHISPPNIAIVNAYSLTKAFQKIDHPLNLLRQE